MLQITWHGVRHRHNKLPPASLKRPDRIFEQFGLFIGSQNSELSFFRFCSKMEASKFTRKPVSLFFIIHPYDPGCLTSTYWLPWLDFQTYWLLVLVKNISRFMVFVGSQRQVEYCLSEGHSQPMGKLYVHYRVI